MQKIVDQINETNEIHDPIFSSLHCPRCGSANIRVTFKPEFEYTYVEEDESINICREYDGVEFQCQDCDYRYGTSSSSVLYLILISLDLPGEVNIKRIDDESIEIAHLNSMNW